MQKKICLDAENKKEKKNCKHFFKKKKASNLLAISYFLPSKTQN
jgi:hypothetical protein